MTRTIASLALLLLILISHAHAASTLGHAALTGPRVSGTDGSGAPIDSCAWLNSGSKQSASRIKSYGKSPDFCQDNESWYQCLVRMYNL